MCNVTYRQDQTGFMTPARVTSETIFTRPRVFRPCRSLYSPPEENGATTRSPILSLLLIIHIKKGLDQIPLKLFWLLVRLVGWCKFWK